MTGKPEDISDQFERNAHRWDAERPRVLFKKEWLDSFLQLLPPAPSILEIGPGAGEPIAQYLIDSGAKLTGLDSSSTMIEICQARFPNQNWHVGDMRELSFPEIFDGIIV